MFTFLKNWFQKDEKKLRALEDLKNDISEDTVMTMPGEEGEAGADAGAKKVPAEPITTELSLHPSWEEQLDQEKKYTLRFLQAELPPMAPGTIGVSGFSLIPGDEGVTVALFFRNAMSRPARFQQLTLSIHLDDHLFAKQRFDLSPLGAIPPGCSRPWEVFFPKESYANYDNFTFTRWKVLMDFGKQVRIWPTHLDLDPEMEKRLSERQKQRLEYIVNALPAMRPDQVEIAGFDIGKNKDGHLLVGVLVRNATDEIYAPSSLKVQITDKSGDVVAGGTVDTTTLRVLPKTSRPWLLMFPANQLRKPDADLSQWHFHIV